MKASLEALKGSSRHIIHMGRNEYKKVSAFLYWLTLHYILLHRFFSIVTLMSSCANLSNIFCHILLFSTAVTLCNLTSAFFLHPYFFLTPCLFSPLSIPSHYLSISAVTRPVYENLQKSSQCLLVNSEMQSATASRQSHLLPLISPLKKVINLLTYLILLMKCFICYPTSSTLYVPLCRT